MKVLKICAGTWENASRDQRELGVVRELGAEVLVLAKGNTEDRGREESVNGFPVHRYTTRPFSRLPNPVNRMLSIFQWARYAASFRADVISGHDLPGWTIGWLSRFYSGKQKPALVYDSHEFELGRNASRSRLQTSMIRFWERRVIRKSAFTVVVNDSIADELVKIYSLRERPIVVRNIPDRWEIDPAACAEKRRELLEAFHGGDYLMMYHGALSRNRGLEEMLRVMPGLDGVKLLLLGNPESPGYLTGLREQYIDALGDRVIVQAAVPHSELWKYIGAADLCAAPIIPRCRSYYFALPNKLFEAAQVGTPLLASDLPEMRRIVTGYRIGEVVNPEDPEALKEKILFMKAQGRKPYMDGLRKAREELTWDREKETLKAAYARLVASC